jgi:hypothetical protein
MGYLQIEDLCILTIVPDIVLFLLVLDFINRTRRLRTQAKYLATVHNRSNGASAQSTAAKTPNSALWSFRHVTASSTQLPGTLDRGQWRIKPDTATDRRIHGFRTSSLARSYWGWILKFHEGSSLAKLGTETVCPFNERQMASLFDFSMVEGISND